MNRKSQIATILTLVMAIIFLFIVITINIGNVAQEKTMISNAADSSALLLASLLGSLANQLRMQLQLYHGRTKNCDIDFAIIGGLIALILSIVVAVVTFGAGTPVAVGAAIALIASIAGSAAIFGFGMWNALVTESPGVFKQFELKFQTLTLEQMLKEKAIQLALFSVVTNPNKVVDTTDIDMDGDTTDKIHAFAKWYNDRLASMPRLGPIITQLYMEIFNRGIGGKAPRIYVLENPKTWKATDNEYGFWIDTNGNLRPDPQQGSLRLEILSDNHQDPRGVIYAHDIYFIDWMQARFIPLVKRLDQYGYGLSKNLDDLLDRINKFIEEVGGSGDKPGFEDVIASLYGMPLDSQIQTFETWFPPLYNGSSNQDWYGRMGEWLNMVDGWISTLQVRTNQINQCVGSCEAPGPYSCGPETGSVCRRIYHSRTCTGTDADGNTYSYDCSYCDPATGWCNCLNGSLINGGRLCPSSHCRPTQTCQTPPDADIDGKSWSIPCCGIADNGLYYQLCNARSSSSGGTSSSCGASRCRDLYYQCRYDPDNNVITREHAINYLTQFRNDVVALRSAFADAYTRSETRKTYPGECEALYQWTDKVGRKGEVTEQEVQHAVLVKLSDNLKAPGFKVPYIHQYRQWFPLPARCTEVAEEEGEFDITVARYDSDVGTTGKSPLAKLWIFKTRGRPTGAEPIFQPTANFVLQNGIVSQTKAHYGPGWTYTKDEIKSGTTQASRRNKDIYIKRLR
jgi:hypothetical protein